MKTIISLCLFVSLIVSARAQVTNPPPDRVFVLFSTAPAPTNLPAISYYVSDTNAAPTNQWVSFSGAAWSDYLTTNWAGWQSWFTNPANSTYQTQTNRNANVQALVVAYSNLTFTAQNWASITNLATAKFAIQAEGDVLLKLKPILQQIYQGQ